jgi:hypothetical protein
VPHTGERGPVAAVMLQVASWIGFGFFAGGTWVLVGELVKKYIVRAG